MSESHGEPRVRFRPRGEAFLLLYKDEERIELPLDAESFDLPPQLDPRLSKPPVRAQIQRVPGGHRLVASPGADLRCNNRRIEKHRVLRGGDEIEVERMFGVYTTAKQELPWPMTLVVWPPEGPPLEIRTHRTRLTLGVHETDVLIEDATLDELHCVIKRFRNGVMQIEDSGSYNGVYVDGKKVHDGMRIRDGAEIRIGNTRVKAWAEAPDVPDLSTAPVQDMFDGLPDTGFDPQSDEPLRPYALELGPDYVQERRRTFEDDVPTKVEPGGERVDVRPRRRPSDQEDYEEAPEGSPDAPVPDWAPLPANSPQRRTGARKRAGFQEAETGADWAKRDKGGLTLVHEKDRPIAPRRGK